MNDLKLDLSFYKIKKFNNPDWEDKKYWIDETAKMLSTSERKHSFAKMAKIFKDEDWSIIKIRERFFEVTKHSNNPQMTWWYLRKQDKLIKK